MTLVIPTIPAMPAGYVATTADMNNLAAACTFLLGKPAARVHDGAGGQTIGAANTTIAFNTKDYDTDSMWASGTNTRLTIQTPGWYKFRYGVSSTTGGHVISSKILSTTGPNNPAGSGITSGEHWAGGTVTSATAGGTAGCSGIWPFYLYIGDFLTVRALGEASGNVTDTSVAPSFFSLEFVSI